MQGNPDAAKEAMYRLDYSGLYAGSLPFIENLRVYGASAGAMWELLNACNHLRQFDSDVSPIEISRRFKVGFQLQREREQKEVVLSMFEEELRLNIKTWQLVDTGTDEDILEAVGAHHVEDLPMILVDLRNELVNVLEEESQGHVDVLLKKLLFKAIRVCEKFSPMVHGVEPEIEIE